MLILYKNIKNLMFLVFFLTFLQKKKENTDLRVIIILEDKNNPLFK